MLTLGISKEVMSQNLSCLKPKKIGNNLCVLHKAAGRSKWHLQDSSANVVKDIKAHWCGTMFTSPALSFRSASPCFIRWFPHSPPPPCDVSFLSPSFLIYKMGLSVQYMCVFGLKEDQKRECACEETTKEGWHWPDMYISVILLKCGKL